MPKPINISRRNFMKKLGLAGAVAVSVITNIGKSDLNKTQVNNQPPRKRIYRHAVSGNYAFTEYPKSFVKKGTADAAIPISDHGEYLEAMDFQTQLQGGNEPPLIFKKYWSGK